MNYTRLGPAGGSGGEAFGDYLIPAGGRLHEIHIYANWCVDGLQWTYTLEESDSTALPKVGAAGGIHHVFFLGEDEYLTGISGRAGWYIDSIQFHTNKRNSHIYGGMGGEQDFFFRAAEGEEIAGLFGREGWYVDALGVIVRQRTDNGSYKATLDEPTTTRAAVFDVDAQAAETRVPFPLDLQKVEGIGPRIAALLIDSGIYDLADLAETSVERLRGILAAAGRRYNIADPATWPEQAALGAKGAWEALKELQESLKGGRQG